jgi:tRNA(His) guanylyltransferase
MKDDLGNRMKNYEVHETGRRLPTDRPIYARIDGRSFSKFTRGMDRPFDARLSQAMIDTTKYLVEATNAVIGYTQSDEISLVWFVDGDNAQMLFDAKSHKLNSVLASMTTAKLFSLIKNWEPYCHRLPHFDARVLSVPDKWEAVNMLRWRYLDARRNAITSAAHSVFGHSKLQNCSTREMLQMMEDAEYDYSALPMRYRYGAFITRDLVQRELTIEEISRIPEKKRPNPGETFTRSQMMTWATDRFMELTNPVEVIFDRESPQFSKD